MRPHRAAAVLLLVLAAGSAACEEDAAPAPVAPAAAADAVPQDRADGPPRVLELAFVGDVHFQLHLAALLERPRGALGPISDTLTRADLAMANLETAITERGSPDPKELEDPADRFHFRTSPAALDVLGAAGIDVVTMANNHGADYGPVGLTDTLRARRHSPVGVIGVGRDRRAAFAPYRVRIRRTEVAVLAADASFRESSSPVWRAGPGTPGVAAARGPAPRALLGAVRRADRAAELVVVYLHWGSAGASCPSDAQRRTALALSAAGADVIVGTHAHVQQGAGWLGDTYVAYGLGNFLWYHDREPVTGVLRVRVEDGRPVAGTWVPARIGTWGRPSPLTGSERHEAVARWQRLRSCAGLSARPASDPAPRPDRAPREQARPEQRRPDRSGYVASVVRISPAEQERMRSSHGPRCPVAWRDLRLLRMTYVGFDGEDHTGEMVVHRGHARAVTGVFERLYDARWPIRRMRVVSDYGGDDDRSMAADNTSAYNCRRVAGSRHWSAHAYGAAIDLNPVENPYLVGGSVRPPAGRDFAGIDRSPRAGTPTGAIRSGDVVVRAFAAIGWEWGGTWAGSPDFQHFAAVRPPGGR